MNWDRLEQFFDLCRADIDSEVLAAVPMVQYVRRLLVSGGSPFAHSEDESALW